ncbi:MAG: hypothetical protein M1827_006645 [Pycnora praestabilis]|nr:MAG: hypothetical protein M1827_006645 [Pycnora praestabilis]
MAQRPSHIMIAGAGLGGTLTALALARLQIPSTLYELRPKDEESGGAIALAPNAARVLDRLNVYERIKDKGFLFEEIYFTDVEGFLIGSPKLGSFERYGYGALRIRRHLLREVLLEMCLEEPLIDLQFGHKITSIMETPSTITLHFSDNLASATGTILIGADGLHSRVREHIYGSKESEPKYSGTTTIGAVTQASDIHWPSGTPLPLPALTFGQKGMFGLMPQNPNGTTIGWFIELTMPELNRDELEEWRSTKAPGLIREKYKDWPEPVNSVIQNSDDNSLSAWVQYSVPNITKWHSPHSVILGDAAHAIPPTAGQGAAMAFEDVATLSHIIKHNRDLFLGGGHERVFERFHELRKPRIEHVRYLTEVSSKSRNESGWLMWQIRKYGMWAYLNLWAGRNHDDIYKYECEVLDPKIQS